MNRPHIEITGPVARFYDLLVFIGTAGLYQRILKRTIEEMEIEPNSRILDLGAGTGKNACMMRKNLSTDGNIVALEIGKQMQRQFQKKCRQYPNVNLWNIRIETALPFTQEFDKVLLSFVIHGFQQEQQQKILSNAFGALKPGGTLYILDWNEMKLEEQGLIFRFFMKKIECPEAHDFVAMNFGQVLSQTGFQNTRELLFAGGKIRLLMAEKKTEHF